MTRVQDEIELHWQSAAECDQEAQGRTGDEGIAAYRRLYLDLKRMPSPEPPADFPQDMERFVRLHAEGARMDAPRWGVRLALAVLCVLALAATVMSPMDPWRHWAIPPGDAPWHALAGAVAAVVASILIERWQGRAGEG